MQNFFKKNKTLLLALTITIITITIFLITRNTTEPYSLNIQVNNSETINIKLDNVGDFVQETDVTPSSHKKYCTEENPSYCFSYFTSENILISYLTNNQNSQREELENVQYLENSSYLKKEIQCEGCAPTGQFISWEPTIDVKDYQALYITNYYNIVDLAKDNMEYNKETFSEDSDRYCLIPLYNNDYILFYGISTAGSNIDYCEILNDMNIFKISY
jgi:hypothetical protein